MPSVFGLRDSKLATLWPALSLQPTAQLSSTLTGFFAGQLLSWLEALWTLYLYLWNGISGNKRNLSVVQGHRNEAGSLATSLVLGVFLVVDINLMVRSPYDLVHYTDTNEFGSSFSAIGVIERRLADVTANRPFLSEIWTTVYRPLREIWEIF